MLVPAVKSRLWGSRSSAPVYPPGVVNQPSKPHPSPETLVRFAEGTSRRRETREVVRHLLRRCRACAVLLAGQVSIPVDQDIYEPIFRRALEKSAELAR